MLLGVGWIHDWWSQLMATSLAAHVQTPYTRSFKKKKTSCLFSDRFFLSVWSSFGSTMFFSFQRYTVIVTIKLNWCHVTISVSNHNNVTNRTLLSPTLMTKNRQTMSTTADAATTIPIITCWLFSIPNKPVPIAAAFCVVVCGVTFD